MIELLAFVGLLSIIYFLFNLFQTETMKKNFRKRQLEYGNDFLRMYKRDKWHFYIVDKSHLPIEEQIRNGIKIEDFKFSLSFPDGIGFLSIYHYESEGWKALYYPKDPVFHSDHYQISRRNFTIHDCFYIADKLYYTRLENKHLSLNELLSNLH